MTNIFDKALEILGPNGEHWTSTTLREEVPGRGVCYCLLGAIVKAKTGREPVGNTDGSTDWAYYAPNEGELRDELVPLIDLIKPKLSLYDQDSRASVNLYRFNDTAKTFEPIAEALQKASRKVSA